MASSSISFPTMDGLASGEPMATLTFLKGVNQGTTVPLDGDRIVLGRQETCSIVLNVPAVSREHAVIRRVQGKFYIEDLKSRNGTCVNTQEVSSAVQLKDNDRIKICDNLITFQEAARKPALPEEMRKGGATIAEEEDDTSSTVEASMSGSSKQILETQPNEKLTFLLNLTTELTQTLSMDELLPQIVPSLFQVFRQADRGFIIVSEEGKLIPKVTRTRRGNDDTTARFSRKIVFRCLETGEAVLSEDASADKRFDLSQSIADCRIRSVMCAPMMSRTTGKALGVIQLDTQDRFKKFTQEDLRLLIAVAGQAAVALENARMAQTLVARAGLERDLQTARQVQMSFLPKKPPQVPGYEFYSFYESAQEVGGDYYDFLPLPGGKQVVMVGDVAGKGVPAALLMAKVSADARFAFLTEPGPAEAVYKLNEFMQEAGMLDRFVTLGVCQLDAATHQMTMVNAGHLPPIIFRGGTGQLEEGMARDRAGFPLGVAEGIPYEADTVTINPGDAVFLFTDGVTDAKNKQEQEFKMDGVRTILSAAAGAMTPRAAGERLVAAVKKHFVGCKQHDDLTIVAFGRT